LTWPTRCASWGASRAGHARGAFDDAARQRPEQV
jgi:hypothetical protein